MQLEAPGSSSQHWSECMTAARVARSAGCSSKPTWPRSTQCAQSSHSMRCRTEDEGAHHGEEGAHRGEEGAQSTTEHMRGCGET